MAHQTHGMQETPAWLDVMAEQVAIYDYRCRKFEAALRSLRRRYQSNIDKREARQ